MLAFVALLALTAAGELAAHPGGTDPYGCHTCRTNCPGWGLEWGEYHCHDGRRRVERPPDKPPPPPPPPATPPAQPLVAPRVAPLEYPNLAPTGLYDGWVIGLSMIDGDTFVVRQGDRLLILRLRHVEAPELAQPFGTEARDRLRVRIVGQPLKVSVGIEQNGVYPVHIEDASGNDLAQWLLSAGLAWAAPGAPHTYRRLQETIRQRRVGLWEQSDPQPPWIHRERGGG